MNDDTRDILKRILLSILLVIVGAFIGATLMQAKNFDAPEPKKAIKFAPTIPPVEIKLPVTWVLTGPSAAPYKNERLAEYQGLLRDRGITNEDHLRLLVAQLLQENGALTEHHTTGDGGCAVGIIQYNACVHHKMNAKRFLEKYPSWQDYHYQLSRMADMVQDRYQRYGGDIKKTIVHHNCPACAPYGDTNAGYYATIQRKSRLFIAL